MAFFDLARLPEWGRTGGLSAPQKMPAFAYGLPVTACGVGTALRAQAGTVCAACYAVRGRYRFPTVKAAQARRLLAVRSSPTWVPDMIRLLSVAYALVPADAQVFRWHDSGDLQSLDHLTQLVAVCASTPELRHWLPTREVGVLRAFLDTGGTFPSNLVVRVSAMRPDEAAPTGPWHTSTVHANAPPLGVPCAAWTGNHRCGSCRQCWDPTVPTVSYPLR